jgi:N-acetylmuramoyl-L-alanine amidase
MAAGRPATGSLRPVVVVAVLSLLVAIAVVAGVASGIGRRARAAERGLLQGAAPSQSPVDSTDTPPPAAPATSTRTGATTVTPSVIPSVIPTGSATLTPTTTAARSLRGRVIVIDPGHNGGNGSHPSTISRLVDAGNGIHKACNTTGTQSRSGYPEHAYAFDVALRLAEVLRARGASVVLTRSNDSGVGPCIDRRAAAANRAGADVLISIHADGSLSPSARGFHVIRSTSMAGGVAVTARSAELALAVRSAFRSGTGMPYSTYLGNGTAFTPRRDIGTLNLSRVPGVMVESGNMRHPTDAALLASSSFRAKAATALADGIGVYLAG